MKVRLAPRRFVYPDVSVSCDERDHTDGQARFIIHPCLVIEVLSPTTTDYDRGDKFEMYRAVATVEECVLVDAEQPVAEVRTRQPDGAWRRATYGPSAEVLLASIGVSVPVAVFYEDADVG